MRLILLSTLSIMLILAVATTQAIERPGPELVESFVALEDKADEPLETEPAPHDVAEIEETPEVPDDPVALDLSPQLQRVGEIRKYLLVEEPNTWSYYEELLRLYTDPEAKDAVFTLLLELEDAFSGSVSPKEALGRIHMREEAWDKAKSYFAAVKEHTDRPFSVGLGLAIAHFETDDPEQSIAEAQELQQKVASYSTKKKDPTQIPRDLQDSHLWMACFVEARAHTRLGHLEAGKKAMERCYDRVELGAQDRDKARQEFGALVAHLGEWRDLSMNEVMKVLD